MFSIEEIIAASDMVLNSLILALGLDGNFLIVMKYFSKITHRIDTPHSNNLI